MKIRFKTWYWGKFIEAEVLPTGANAAMWEPYDEQRHGWHHAEEAEAESYCDCEDCAEGVPCSKDCDRDIECAGCREARLNEEDDRASIDFATGRR